MSLDLHDVLEAGAAFPTREPNIAEAWQQGRRRRLRRHGARVAAAIALVSGVTIGVIAVVVRDDTTPRIAATAPGDWLTYRDDAHGLSISYPASWRAATSTLTPVLVDPVVPIALGTYPLEPQQLGECDIVPKRALEALAPTDAFIAVYVFGGMASWDANTDRPARFGPNLPWNGRVQCTENVRGSVRSLNFSDNGKRLSVLVATGSEVSAERQAEIYGILDTLTVDP